MIRSTWLIAIVSHVNKANEFIHRYKNPLNGIRIEQISKSEHIRSINRFRCVVFSSFISCIYIFIWQSLAFEVSSHEIVVIGIWKQNKQIITTLWIAYGNKPIVIAQSQIRGGFVLARAKKNSERYTNIVA